VFRFEALTMSESEVEGLEEAFKLGMGLELEGTELLEEAACSGTPEA
jgi:hypothetical protein